MFYCQLEMYLTCLLVNTCANKSATKIEVYGFRFNALGQMNHTFYL